MHGKVYFPDIETMTAFLLGLVGKTTAVFTAYEDPQRAGAVAQAAFETATLVAI